LGLRVPFGIAGGAQAVAHNVLVTVELEDGTVGHGEAAPLPAYNGETQAQALAVLQSAQSWLAGAGADRWTELAAEFRRRGGAHCGSAQCAFETAVVDALARQQGQPLWRFFGGAGTTLETDATITTGTEAEAAEAAAAFVRRGVRTLKVKVGGPAGPAHDLARIAAVVAAAPAARLILDGNAALTRPAAGELLHGLREQRVTPVLLEQWLAKDDLVGLRALGQESGWPVAADESVVTPEDVLRIAHAGAAQVINVKLMKAGIATALDVVRVAQATGLELMIGGNVESTLAMTTSACFAAGLGGFRCADLDTPWFLVDQPLTGGMSYEGATISVADVGVGHGVTPR
jgi:L-Ala-D/L-Glu epimerase